MEEKKEKILQIVLGAIAFIAAILVDKFTTFSMLTNFLIYLIPYLIVAYDSVKEGIEGIKEGEIFNENILMIIASLGAMLIGFINPEEPQFAEGIFVMLFFNVGELFEIIAEGKSEKSINALMDIRPDYANLLVMKEEEREEEKVAEKAEGAKEAFSGLNDNALRQEKIEKVDASSVKIDDIIVVNPGEKVPLDGIVIEGTSSVNTVAVTGESVPRQIHVGDEIYSGFVNESGVLKVKVTKTFETSTASRIIELVKNASSKKSNSEKFISKFSKIYTPAVIVLALIIAVIPSIVTKDFVTWISRALTFLVVSCPCALVISVPLAYFGGIGAASKKGVLFKGSNFLEAITNMGTIIFDKTGTLTEGVFEVTAIHPKELNEDELLHIAAHAEEHSSHPIAVSLMNGYNKIKSENDHCKIEEVSEIAGLGVKAKVNDEEIFVGNDKLMNEIKIKYEPCHHVGTIIHIASNEKYYGHIVISDKIKSDSKHAIEYFKKHHIKTVMLTGDSSAIAENISEELGIHEYYAELLPQDKVAKAEEIINGAHETKKLVAFVGDGINDAPVIARSDIGISMGNIGSDAAIEASDVVLMRDSLSSIIDGIKISRKTSLIAKENIILSIIVKIAVLILSAFGFANMWMAVFADVGVTVIAVLNSMRTLR